MKFFGKYAIAVFAAGFLAQVEATPTSKKIAGDVASRQENDGNPAEPQESDNEFDSGSAAAALTAGLVAMGAGSDNLSPGAEAAVDFITSSGELVSQVFPPPYNVIASIGFATLGSLFGGGGGAGVSNEAILNAVQEGFKKVFMRLDAIENAIVELSAAIDDLARVTRFNSQVVQQIYHEIWVDPFQRIHAAYSSLMETYYPTSASRSWDDFFEKANDLRGELEAEVFDSFAVSNLRDYLDWYELDINNIQATDKINDMGKCGVTFLFQYLMTVRSELFLISSFGSYERVNNCNGDDEICWKVNDDLIQAYASKYKEQLVEYDFMILNAQERGGLGIAHLVPKSAAQLLEGAQDDELGFCFQCDSSGTGDCSDYNPYPWPTTSNRVEGSSVDDVYTYQMCNANPFDKKWYYYDKYCPNFSDATGRPCQTQFGGQVFEDGCRYTCNNGSYVTGYTRPPKTENKEQLTQFSANRGGLGCCSCSCLSSGDYNGDIAGTQDDHTTYARHCDKKELEYSPFPTSNVPDTDFLEIDKYFRISRVDDKHLSISAVTRSYQTRTKEEGSLGSYFTRDDIVTPMIFTNDGTTQKGKPYEHKYNGWTGWAHATKSRGGGIVFGEYTVQIADWRIRATDDASQSHLSVTHENGNVSRIYKCDGTQYDNIKDFSGYKSPLGNPKCAFITKKYLQIGNWRIGRWTNEQHLSVTHRNGNTGEYYKTDGVWRSSKKDYGSGGIWNLNEPVLYGTKNGCSQLSTSDSKCFAPTTAPATGSYYLGCGATSRCNGQRQEADVAETHELRCCSTQSLEGWSQYNPGSGCWGLSSVDGPGDAGCVHAVNFNEGRKKCRDAGGDLCTLAQLEADCSRGSGCSHDYDMIWSLDKVP